MYDPDPPYSIGEALLLILLNEPLSAFALLGPCLLVLYAWDWIRRKWRS